MFGMFGIYQPAVLGDSPVTLWKILCNFSNVMENVTVPPVYRLLTGTCPVPTASGKSTALGLISQLIGMHMVSQSSGQFVSDLTNTTIPVCWDDPTHTSHLCQFLMALAIKHRGKEIKSHWHHFYSPWILRWMMTRGDGFFVYIYGYSMITSMP